MEATVKKDGDVFDSDEVAPEKTTGKSGTTYERHPAFGMIGASRINQGGRGATLHGSDFGHHHYVMVTVQSSAVSRDLSHDWIHSDGHEYIRVALSEAQWATFVSSMNVGDGVPCTIEHVGGKRVPAILPTVDRREQFESEMRQTVHDAIQQLRDLQALVGTLVAGNAKARAAMHEHIARAIQELEKNVPFVAKSFDEHMDRTTERAKIEVNAYLQATLVRAGMQALGAQPPFTLPDGKDRED
jgi:hypothetical protein